MPIIAVEITKTRDEKETQPSSPPQKNTTKQTNKQRQKRTRGNRSYSEWVRSKLFCCAFKLGFLQLICKASLILKSNLELALSIILKQRELSESMHVEEECRCLKIWDLSSLLISASILVLKWQLAQVNYVLGKISNH